MVESKHTLGTVARNRPKQRHYRQSATRVNGLLLPSNGIRMNGGKLLTLS